MVRRKYHDVNKLYLMNRGNHKPNNYLKKYLYKSLTQHRGCQRHDAVVGPAFGPHPLGMQPIPIEKVVQIG